MTNAELLETSNGLLLADSNPDLLRDLLRQFDDAVAQHGVELDSLLNPGIAPDEVREAFAEVDLVAPDELIVWYGWHNGLRVNERGRYLGLSPFVAHADVKWSVASYKYAVENMIPMGLWADKWFGMESDRGLAVYCSGRPTDAPLLRRDDVEEFEFTETSTAHQIVSLCTMVAWWVEAFGAGAVQRADTGDFVDWKYDAVLLSSIDHGTAILS